MRKESVIFSHPTGNANVRAALSGMLEKGILTEFQTSVACFENSLFYSLAKGPLSEFRRRTFEQRLQQYTVTHPLRDISRLVAGKLGFNSLLSQEKGIFSVDAVYHEIDRKTADSIRRHPNKFSAVYAYEDGALASFNEAEKHGILKLYDQPIGYWRAAKALMDKERETRPEWAATLSGFQDSISKLNRKDEEIQLANTIYAASTFTKKTLEYYPGLLSDIEVIPYGFPDVSAPKEYTYNANRKLEVLFVGGLSQRKGIANVFEAAAQLKEYINLTVIGRPGTEDCKILNESLKNCTWIQGLPHHKILEEMRKADVLVFPSLFEGFGLVITEAMSQGTPVITTDRTAGPDFIMHNHNGWLSEAGCTENLVKQLQTIIEQPDLIEKNGNEALKTASERPWSVYAGELAESIIKKHQNLELAN